MARRFASSNEQEIEKLLKQKDSENKRRLKELFHEYLKEKSVQRPEDKKDTNVKIVCRYFVYLKTMYNVIGKRYQPKPEAEANNSYLDLDYSGYRKTTSNNCLKLIKKSLIFIKEMTLRRKWPFRGHLNFFLNKYYDKAINIQIDACLTFFSFKIFVYLLGYVAKVWEHTGGFCSCAQCYC